MILMYNGKLIRLPPKGRLIVVSDLHGNHKDYRSYLDLWDSSDDDCHIVFIGDLIHSSFEPDGSLEILDDAIIKSKKYPNFHVLLGNHEWAHITCTDIYRNEKNQIASFEELVRTGKGSLQPSLDNYIGFFKSLPFFLKTDNGVFISHAGPSRNICSIDDFNHVFDDYENDLLDDFLWNRYGNDYTSKDVSKFLRIIESNCMVIGHNNVNGYELLGKQLIISSSFMTSTKTYLDIDLSKNIENIRDLMEFLEFLK